MAALTLNGSTSGSVTLQPPAVAGSNTLTIPAATGTVIVTTGTTANQIFFGGASSGTFAQSSNLFWDNTNSRLGIGTASSSAKLHVFGNSSNAIAIFDKDGANQGYYQLKNSTQSYSTYIDINNNGTNWLALYDTTNSSLIDVYVPGASSYRSFYTVGTERARIDSSGNLLVGTTSTVGKISSKATANPGAGYNLYLQNTWSGDGGYPSLYIAKYDNNTTTSQLFIRFSVNNETQACGQINANGANTAAFGTFSDARLKENIEILPSQLSNVCALKPCEFDYIDGAGHQIGFIAQEMQQVYPDVVGEDENGMLTITGWSKTEARLVKAIQELSAKLDAAEARIAALEAK